MKKIPDYIIGISQILLCLGIILILLKPGLFLYQDAAPSIPLNSFFISTVNTWSNQAFLGYDSSLSLLPRIFYYALNDFTFFIFHSPYLTQIFLYLFLLVYGFFNFYNFLNYNLKNRNISMLLAFLGILNFFVIDRLIHPFILLGYFTIPICIMFLQRSLSKESKLTDYIFFSLSTLLLLISPQQTYVFLIISGIIILSSFNSLKNFKTNLWKVIILVVLSVLINSYYFLPLAFSASGNQLNHASAQLNNAIYHYSVDNNLFNVLRFTGYFYTQIHLNDLFLMFSFIIPFFIILSFFNKNLWKWKIMFLIGIFLSTLVVLFPSLVDIFKSHLPLFSSITDTAYFIPVIILPSLVLLGNLALNLKKNTYKLFAFLLILVLFLNLFCFNSAFTKDSLNKEYLDASNYLKKETTSRALILPISWVQAFPDSSYVYSGIYYSLFNGKPLAGLRVSELMQNESFNYNIKIEESFYNNTLSTEELMPMNVKQIVILKNNKDAKDRDFLTPIAGDYYAISSFLENNKKEINLEYSNSLVDIYEIKNTLPHIISKNSEFMNINPAKYRVYIKNISENQIFSFLESYHDAWKLYLVKNPEDDWCSKIKAYSSDNIETLECRHSYEFFEGEELSYLKQKSVFESSHKISYEYANSWTINPEYIKNNYSPDYYTLNPDGSINIELVLYFKPQSYFYLGILISLITGIIFAFCLIFYYCKSKKHKLKNKSR